MSESEHYAGREQTLVKHKILEGYLQRFAHIVGSWCNSITYVDCFSGPWQAKSEALEDTSFSIALSQLRQARETHRAQGRSVKLRCFFVERDPSAHARLKEFADKIDDAEIETRNCELEEAVGDIVAFVKKGGASTFPFILIDPTGWTGFGMDTIAPLLQLRPGEVLINFMTEYIRRFVESSDPKIAESFDSMYGLDDVRSRIQGLEGLDREDALIELYSRSIMRTGGFRYVCCAVVIHREKERRQYHLIYGTRHWRGAEVFKDSERRGMQVMEDARAAAEQRSREQKTGQKELFSAEEMHDPTYYLSLRDRYRDKARAGVEELLRSRPRVAYDAAWEVTVPFPLAWESDLKEWLSDWHKQGWVRYEGMKPRQRVPKLGEGISLIWTGPSGSPGSEVV